MKYICKIKGSETITYGKIYECTEVDRRNPPDLYRMKSDDGMYRWYTIGGFEALSEHRRKIIKGILK